MPSLFNGESTIYWAQFQRRKIQDCLPTHQISGVLSLSTFLAIILGIQGLKMSKPYRNIFGSATMPSLESYALSQRPLLPYWNAALECQYFTIVPEVPYHKILGLTRIGHTMALSLLLAGQQYHNIWKKADSFR